MPIVSSPISADRIAMAEGAALAGCRVWLTRPLAQSASWADALTKAGARVTCQPLIAIDALPDRPAAATALQAAATADIVIATSANAIAGAAQLDDRWQPRGRLLAVGAATAVVFAGWVRRAVEQPARSDSEGLLAHLADTRLAGRRIAILSGEGGRTTLADDLQARRARVSRIALYRRCPVALETPQIAQLLSENDVLIVTSGAGWQALFAQVDAAQAERLRALSLVAPSLRVVEQTRIDIDWQHEPIVLEDMTPLGAGVAVARAWQARITNPAGRMQP